MKRRTFLQYSSALGLGALFPEALHAQNPSSPRQPNIIFILADDLGYEGIRANGGLSYETPHLDQLAAEGIRFEHCYGQPLCTPSRVQLMTGQYNVRNYRSFGILERTETTFAHRFKAKGYATCIAGKWQLGSEPDSPQHFGFDESCLWQHTRQRTDKKKRDTRYPNPKVDINGKARDDHQGGYGPDVAARFICDFIERKKDQPFLAYYPMILPHCPFVPTPDSQDWNPKDRGSKSYKGKAKHFPDMVRYMDKLVGTITATLEAHGLRENTLILFTGDNGTDTPIVSQLNDTEVAGAKGKMTDAGTRVPLIANWPGVIPPAQVSQDLVDFSDFYPTLLDVAGIEVDRPQTIDGRSFLPLLRGEKGTPREWVYSWYLAKGNGKKKIEAKAWARDQRYKLYNNGKLFDVQEDVLEKRPLMNLSEEQGRTRKVLQATLDHYASLR